MVRPARLRSEVHPPSTGDNTATQDPPSTHVTAGTSTQPIPVSTHTAGTSNPTITAPQSTAPLIFGTLPPITSLVATTTAGGTHYSTVMTTTRGQTDEYEVYTDNDSSEESERDYDIPPRRRRDGNQGRDSQHHTRQNNPESRGPTHQEYEARIRAFEQQIDQLRRDMAAHQARQQPPEPRVETPQNTSMTRIHLLPPGDPDNPVPPFTEEIMAARISRKFKLPTIKAYDGTGDPANHVRTFMNALLLQPVTEAIKCRAFPQTLSGMSQH